MVKQLKKNYYRDLWALGVNGYVYEGGWINNKWDYNTIFGADFEYSWMESELLIGNKKEKDYKFGDEIPVLMKEFLNGVEVKSSYKSTEIYRYKIRHNNNGWIYKFRNSAGQDLIIRHSQANYSYPELINNNNIYKLKLKTNYPIKSRFYCDGDYIVLRNVEYLNINGLRNQFGETIKSPIMFWIRTIGVKGKNPSLKKDFNF